MSNGYGQIFLLLLAIGLILLASSGKGRQVWDLFTGQGSLASEKDVEKRSKEKSIEEGDKAGSGSGGVMA